MKSKKSLIVVPAQNTEGGVYNFYMNLKPHLTDEYFLLGQEKNIKSKNKISLFFIRYRRFKKQLESENYSTVVLNPSLNIMAVLRDSMLASYSFRKKRKVIVFWRGWNPNHVKFLKFPFSIMTRSLLKPHATVTLSSEVEKTLKEFNCKGTFHRLSTTVSDALFNFNETHPKPERFEKYFNILFLSRIETAKGIFELLEAFQAVQKLHPNVHLNIAGEGETKKKLIDKVANLGLRNVHFLGYVRDEQKYKTLQNNDLLVLPSYTEGMPNAVLEAMAMGLPILITRVGGLVDFFEDTKMGYFVDVKSVSDLQEKMELIISNPKKNKEMSERNMKFAEENFKSRQIARKLSEIIMQTAEN